MNSSTHKPRVRDRANSSRQWWTTLNRSSPAPSSPFEDVSLAATPDALAGEFTVGVDLGQSFDPTAVAVVRKLQGTSDAPIFQIGHLERLPLHTPYGAVVNHVGHLIQRLRAPAELVIDYHGRRQTRVRHVPDRGPRADRRLDCCWRRANKRAADLPRPQADADLARAGLTAWRPAEDT